MNDNTNDFETVENRHEIIAAYDAIDTNPNGDPRSPENEPRIDNQTQQAVVTDVRFKRYIRDQLIADGYPIYVKKVDGDHHARDFLIDDVLEPVKEELRKDDISAEEIRRLLTDNATDIRMFGAALSVSGDTEAADVVKGVVSNLTGPVQFSPARSLNEVVLNDEYSKLTSVISTQEGSGGGSFATDKRLKYAFIPFSGVVDPYAAQKTNLRREDVERLDTLCWRAVQNQTLSRSKYGHTPRLYLRVEYDGDYYIGRLSDDLSLDSELSKPSEHIRSVSDMIVSVDDLVEQLERNSDNIQSIAFNADPRLELSYNGDVYTADEFPSLVDGVEFQTIDVKEYPTAE